MDNVTDRSIRLRVVAYRTITVSAYQIVVIITIIVSNAYH